MTLREKNTTMAIAAGERVATARREVEAARAENATAAATWEAERARKEAELRRRLSEAEERHAAILARRSDEHRSVVYLPQTIE